jgi:hypothetical protein
MAGNAAFLVLLTASTGLRAQLSSDTSGFSQQQQVETLVMIRHGERANGGLGQLDCEGLNRSLALPDVLIGRFGKPNYVFAPNPSDQIDEGGPQSYVRPLATIEPTAIRAGLPVSTQIGFSDIKALQKELTKAKYGGSLIFVAWEHVNLQLFAQQLIKSYGGNPAVVPEWQGNDYDTIYVFQISQQDEKPNLTFRIEQERLNGMLSTACPSGAASSQPSMTR